MAAYSILEAKSNFDALVDDAARGEEVVIVEPGKPRLQLVPLQQPDEPGPSGIVRRSGQHLAGWAEIPGSLDDPLPEETQRPLGMLD